MKSNKTKKLLSAAAVLAISASAAFSIIPLAACNNGSTGDIPEKLITADKNHNPHTISTATGVVETKSSGTVYYVAPLEDGGSNTNTGLSWDSPLTIEHVLGSDRMSLSEGDTVYVKPGVYKLPIMITVAEQVKGTYNNYIRIVNAALESESGYKGEEKLVTLDFSYQNFGSIMRGVQIYGSYIYWYGIDVCGAGDNGLYVGGSYNTIEYSEFYNNRDTGLQLGRIESADTTIDEWPSYNLIKNCTSHNNYDNETYGENADGFAAKLTVGYGNVFDGCIAYRNSDDGWDLYAKSDTGNIGCVIIYNCVAFENGYLEYTQEQNNARFVDLTGHPSYNHDYDESNVNSYKTRDGDGNGFKLGGSVMEGDVVMYNCLSFNNRMHGVTDNSNPGFLKVEGVTSYDNSAAIDDNPESSTFGQIIRAVNHDKHGNIDVSRQVYSYNTVINSLSVTSGIPLALDTDAYRGSVTDSILLGAGNRQNIVKGSIDADTKNGGGVVKTHDGAPLVASEIFEALPIVYTPGDGTTPASHAYNITGLEDLYAVGASGALSESRVHKAYRNPDKSINMGTILAKKAGIDDSKLISGKNIGSTLNLENWGDYKHFFERDFVNGSAASQDQANLERALETLTINTDSNAVYQDFEVPVKLNGCTISWQSGNTDYVKVGTEVEESFSTSKYITMAVYRPVEADVKVVLTATVTCGSAHDEKTFELTIKCGIPTIGAISVRTPKGEIVSEGGSYVVDQYAIFKEPEVLVENGLDYNGKLLTKEQFTCTSTYKYATDKNSPFVQIKGFTPSNAGVYLVTKTISLVSDPGQQKSMTYTLFVSSQSAKVDFLADASDVAVNKNGYIISGSLSNATGRIYALSSAENITVTAENIKTLAGVESFNFRNDSISFQFKNANAGAYKIYYALANLNDEITSKIYTADVTVTAVDTTSKFITMAGGNPVSSENPKTSIYQLTKDLDFTGVSYTVGAKAFTGLLNGLGHTVKNVTINRTSDYAGLFYKVEGGTVENIKFDNISITSTARKVGVIAESYGGYYHNIAMTNIKVSGGERTGGLIGQACEGLEPTYISQVSIVNEDSPNYYITSGTSKRAGGIIGIIQTTSNPAGDCDIYISDCYVTADISGLEQIGGVVGSFDNAKTNIGYYLEINHCYFGGTASSTYATPRVGGILGYQSGNVGSFKINGCISIGRLYNQGNYIAVSLKTASPILGGYSSAAVNEVTNCIATQQEYNSDYLVEIYSSRNLQRNRAGLEAALGAGHEEKWTFVSANDPDHPTWLQAPYLTLNFLPVD